eukprot:COSAG06_NODE_49308_length_326_cov_0.898678_1_plen_27_part_10
MTLIGTTKAGPIAPHQRQYMARLPLLS